MFPTIELSGKALFHCFEKRLQNRIVSASVGKVATEQDLNLADKTGGIGPALCQATVAAWWWHERFGLKTVKGWVTSGLSWQFFVSNANPDYQGAVVSVLPRISLKRLDEYKEDNELAQVMGLLYDWLKMT
ncbi:hypothetical protein H0H92_001335 [Tricholoma furcatifolium]|nr:hypothetical protein H0H92_001335 [Tricholoma furcatifolium]